MNRGKILALTVLFSLVPFTVYANSSWVWLTKAKPLTILPIVAVLTIVIEALIIIKQAHIMKKTKAVLVVTGANILSFIIPFLIKYSEMKLFYGGGPILRRLAEGPNYIVGFYFLLITLIIEIPVVFFLLKDKENMEDLIKFTILSNIITTIMVWGVERLFCRGVW